MSEFEQEEQPQQIANSLVKQYGPRAVIRASAVGYGHAATGEVNLALKWLTVLHSVQEILASETSGQSWIRDPQVTDRGTVH